MRWPATARPASAGDRRRRHRRDRSAARIPAQRLHRLPPPRQQGGRRLDAGGAEGHDRGEGDAARRYALAVHDRRGGRRRRVLALTNESPPSSRSTTAPPPRIRIRTNSASRSPWPTRPARSTSTSPEAREALPRQRHPLSEGRLPALPLGFGLGSGAGHDVRAALITFGVDASHGYERIHMHALRSLAELMTAYATSPSKSPATQLRDCLDVAAQAAPCHGAAWPRCTRRDSRDR
jgi:hypothetical protein